MNTSKVTAIMVTEEDFDRAIMMNMVKNILFGKEEHHE